MKYGRLTVIEGSEYLKSVGKQGRKTTYVTAICECGVSKDYLLNNLKVGGTVSCGCYHKEIKTRHGLGNHKLYKVWHNIIQRCTNPKCSAYANYGERGIAICDEWRNDFKAFINWALANGWDEALKIDRIDTGGNYSPDNCRFITRNINQMNKRSFGISLFKGVCFHKKANKWHARIAIKGERKNLGLFSDELEAAKAYNDAIIKHFPNNPELLN